MKSSGSNKGPIPEASMTLMANRTGMEDRCVGSARQISGSRAALRRTRHLAVEPAFVAEGTLRHENTERSRAWRLVGKASDFVLSTIFHIVSSANAASS